MPRKTEITLRGQMLFKHLIKIRVNIGETKIHIYYFEVRIHYYIIKDPFIITKLTTK